jgi:muconolactone delta-isomerase
MIQAQTSTSHVNDVIYQVVNKIAEVEDVDPLELTENQGESLALQRGEDVNPPLFDVIDSDALEQIFTTAPTADRIEVQVTFSYNGYDVTVRDDGCVSVEECEE